MTRSHAEKRKRWGGHVPGVVPGSASHSQTQGHWGMTEGSRREPARAQQLSPSNHVAGSGPRQGRERSSKCSAIDRLVKSRRVCLWKTGQLQTILGRICNGLGKWSRHVVGFGGGIGYAGTAAWFKNQIQRCDFPKKSKAWPSPHVCG